jgi:hypothetical protein
MEGPDATDDGMVPVAVVTVPLDHFRRDRSRVPQETPER